MEVNKNLIVQIRYDCVFGVYTLYLNGEAADDFEYDGSQFIEEFSFNKWVGKMFDFNVNNEKEVNNFLKKYLVDYNELTKTFMPKEGEAYWRIINGCVQELTAQYDFNKHTFVSENNLFFPTKEGAEYHVETVVLMSRVDK